MKRFFYILFLVLFGLFGIVNEGWSDEVCYTLTPASGSNNSYAGNCDVTISGITWNLTGNSQMLPWRIGGKSISNKDRALYSKTKINDNVSRIKITHGTTSSSITVNSMTVIVSKNSDFSSPESTLTPSFAANTTVTINRPDGKNWSECYYKIIYNVTVSAGSNNFLEFSEANFYKESETPSYTITAQSNNDDYGTVSLDGNVITGSPNTGYRYATPAYTLSPANSATISQSGDAFTVTPSANTTVTINFEAIPSYTINWYSNTELFHTQTDLEGESYEDPGSPSSIDCDGTKVFVGWTKNENYSNESVAPNDLFSYSSTMEITGNDDYYAVFANEQIDETTKTYSFDITPDDFNGTSYAANNNEKTTTAVATDNSGATFSVIWVSYDVMLQSANIQFKGNSGYIYNSVDLGTINSINVTSTAGTYTEYYGNSAHPTSGTYATDKGFFTIKNTHKNAGHASNINITFTKTITSGTTYSNYTTQCCPSVLYPQVLSLTDIYSAKLVWNNQNSVSSYDLTLSPSGTIEITDTIAYITNLSRSTNYTYELKANGDGCSKITQGSFKTKSPEIDIVEWTPTSISIAADIEEGDKIYIENKEEGGEENIADSIFFSKYFEAAGSVKLLGIFNGTGHDIDLSEYSLSLAQAKKSATAFKNTKFKNILKSGGANLTSSELLLENNEELILISYSSNDNDLAIIDCAKENEKSNFSSYIKISTPELQFNGDDAIALVNPQGNFIDLIGAGTQAGGSNITNVVATSVSGGTYNGFMDNPGGWYKTTGIDLVMDTAGYALSTNRCLLIRKDTVKSGLNAVARNTEDFVTLGTDWKGLQIPGSTSGDGLGITNACNGFDKVGSFDYSSYYLLYNPLIEKTTIGGLLQSDGSYKIGSDTLRLDTLACDELKIVTYSSSDELVNEQTVQVPIMITSTLNTSEIPYSVDTCSTCNIVILNNAKLTVDNEKNVTKNVTVYPGGILSVPEGKTYTVNKLTLRRENNKVPYLSYKGTLDIKKGMFFEMRVDGTDWRWFTLPDTFNILDIGANSKTHGNYDFGALVKYYNGEWRANNGRGGWRFPQDDDITKFAPGVGVNIGNYWLNEYIKKIYKITLDTAILTNEKNAKSIYVEAYGETNTPANDKGWNLIGNPYMDIYHVGGDFGEGIIVLDSLVKEIINGQWTGKWNPSGVKTTLRYIVVPSDKQEQHIIDAGGYEQICIKSDAYRLEPFTSFFIQAGVTSNLTFSVSSVAKAPAKNVIINDETFLRVCIGNVKTGCYISNKFTDEYEIGDDLESLYSTYQLINGYKLLYSAINDSIINSGVKIYTPGGNLHLDEKTNVYEFDEISALYNGNWYDLLHGETVDVTGEFILQARRKPHGVTTNIYNTETYNDIQKVIYDGNVFIKKNNHIFTVLGELVK